MYFFFFFLLSSFLVLLMLLLLLLSLFVFSGRSSLSLTVPPSDDSMGISSGGYEFSGVHNGYVSMVMGAPNFALVNLEPVFFGIDDVWQLCTNLSASLSPSLLSGHAALVYASLDYNRSCTFAQQVWFCFVLFSGLARFDSSLSFLRF